MSAIDQLFVDLRAAGRKALMPFVTAGDPDLLLTAELLRSLQDCGCQLCELGIPYSDPIADGPVIQASYNRALGQGVKLDGIFEMLRQTAPPLSMPVVSMVSYAIVYRRGLERYLDDAQAAGVSGMIVPDLPVEEAVGVAEACRRRDFSLIQLVTPTTPRSRAVQIAESTTGFLYYVSVTGITGERQELPPALLDNVQWLREQTKLPICIGFGISRPEHIERLKSVADGFIVGSALVRRLENAGAGPRQRAQALQDVGQLMRELLAACR